MWNLLQYVKVRSEKTPFSFSLILYEILTRFLIAFPHQTSYLPSCIIDPNFDYSTLLSKAIPIFTLCGQYFLSQSIN